MIPTSEIERLYRIERWSPAKIAEHLGATKQAVYERMRKAGLPLDPARRKRSPELTINRKRLRHLFEVQRLSIQQVADLLGTKRGRVKEAIKIRGISRQARDTRHKKYPQLAKLKIGESFDFPLWRPELATFTNLQRDAKLLGIRIVIRRVDKTTAKITRTPLMTPENFGSIYRSGMAKKAIVEVFTQIQNPYPKFCVKSGLFRRDANSVIKAPL